jgi:predicted nucleotidyltransferase
MPVREFDPGRILGLLTARGVDFVVIGGIAAVLHGSARNTQDLDICFATDEANLVALGKVLVELEARLRGVADAVPFVPDHDTLRRVENLTLETTAGDFDLLARPDGAPPFARLRENAERYDVGAFAVLVASIEDLLAMKRAAGRGKDALDVEELTAIARLRARSDLVG